MFVGRTEELESIGRSCLVSARNVLVTAPAGVGKTTLVRQVATIAERRRHEVVWVAGLPGAAAPLAPFADLLTGADAVPSQSPLELMVRLRAELVRRSAEHATALVVDDAHWLDDASTSLVRQLVAGGAPPMILLMRTGEQVPPGLEWVRADPSFDHVELGPLQRGECDELVGALLEGPVTQALSDTAWRLSAGVPLFVTEAVRTAVANGTVARRGRGPWDLTAPVDQPVSISRVIRAHVDHLDGQARALLVSVAVGGALSLPVVERLRGAEQLGVLQREGFAVVSTDRPVAVVEVAHDLQRHAVVTALDAVERRAVLRDLIDAIEGGPAEPSEVTLAARFRLEVGRPDAAAYERGASVAFLQFALDLALELADAAIAAGAGARAHLLRAQALGALGRLADADRAFEDATSAVSEDAAVAEVAIARAADAVMYRADVPRAIEVLDEAAARVEPGSERDAIRAFGAIARFYGGDLRGAVREGEELLDTRPFPLEAAVALGSAWAILGDPEAVLSCSLRAVRAVPRGTEPPYFVFHNLPWTRLMALWQLGRLRDGSDLYEDFRRHGVGTASTGSALATIAMPATYQLLRGHLDDAAEGYSRVALLLDVQPMHVATFNHLLEVTLHAQRGDLLAADRALERLDAYPAAARAGFRWWEDRARAQLAAASGDVAAAVDTSLALAERHSGEWFHVTTSLHDVVRFGHPERSLDGLAVAAERPGATWWDRTCHQHAASLSGHGSLPAVAMEFERGGLDLVALEVLSQALDAGVTPSQRSILLAQCSELALRCGTVRTPALDRASVGLTRREIQVARLAARGSTDREIARLLGTSVRTVGNQLSSVYRKLGISSRADLPERLSEDDRPAWVERR